MLWFTLIKSRNIGSFSTSRERVLIGVARAKIWPANYVTPFAILREGLNVRLVCNPHCAFDLIDTQVTLMKEVS